MKNLAVSIILVLIVVSLSLAYSVYFEPNQLQTTPGPDTTSPTAAGPTPTQFSSGLDSTQTVTVNGKTYRFHFYRIDRPQNLILVNNTKNREDSQKLAGKLPLHFLRV